MDAIIMDRKSFLKTAFTLATPIIVQNLINTLVNVADTLMLGYVSQSAMSASALVGQLQLILLMLYSGLATGASVLSAQYWGKKDFETIERVLCLAVKISLILSVIFFSIAEFLPETMMHLFTSDIQIIHEGAQYLRVIGFSWLFMAISQMYISVQRSIGKVTLPSVTYCISLLVNVFLNAAFIFGFWVFPKLGLPGVALGTVIARLCETIICIVHSLHTKEVRFRLNLLFRKSGVLMHDFFKLSIPSMINDGAWSLANFMFSVILGHLGSDIVAANTVAITARNIGAMVSRGVSNATTIIIGKSLGENQFAATRVYAKRMTFLSFLFGVLGGLVIITIRPAILMIYQNKLTTTALGYLRVILLMEAYHIIGEAMNTCWICGCFRGGGDARFGMIVDTLSMWLIAVPLTAIAAFLLKLPVVWVYFFLCLDEFEKMLPCYLHYRKFTWMRNITRDKVDIEV